MLFRSIGLVFSILFSYLSSKIIVKPILIAEKISSDVERNKNVANKKINVKVVNPKIKTIKSKIKRNKNLQVSFKTHDNKAIKNTKVTLKIKGKTYTVKTNNKGIVKLKLKVKKGTYKVKTAFKSPAKYGKTTKTLKIKVI